jgi:hypothetical protein
MSQRKAQKSTTIEEILSKAIREHDDKRLTELVEQLDRALDVAAFDLLLAEEAA